MASSTGRLEDILQTVKDARRILTEFLTTDLDVALTFLKIASTSNNSDTVQRNLKNARTAYETVRRYLPRAHCTKAELSLPKTSCSYSEAPSATFG